MLSRVADNLYWLSRYLERAEHTARVLDLTLNLLLEQRTNEPLQARMNRVMEGLFAQTLPENATLFELTAELAFNPKNTASISFCLANARENARQIREQISSEMWEHLNGLYFKVTQTSVEDVWYSQSMHSFFRMVKEGAQLFQGLTGSTMSRNECWRFLQVGRYLERATYNAHFLDVQIAELQRSEHYPVISKDFMNWVGLLKCFTAFEAYCKVHTADLKSERIIEFLLLNAEFPHSVRFSIDKMSEALNSIEAMTETKRAGKLKRLTGKLRSELGYSQIDEVLESGLTDFLNGIQRQTARIHDGIYDVYIAYPIEEAIAQ
ncbi:MAG TPA: alpha-E domain-containing protein [Pyrinomonadaceae bacterium]|nr:alpha-E domain-containing protein [Pyrinomonadaceae bacterium]